MPITAREQGTLPQVIEAMLTPEFYPHPVTDIELRQTHTSYVLLAGQFAYKIRKAVRFAFIDCSTTARRRALCQRELELNRRLAPDVYLAVVAIVQIRGRILLEQSSDNPADALEFAIKMRRLPEERRLDLMIKRNAGTADNISYIANTIKRFHQNAPNTHSWAYGAAASIWRMAIGNLVEIEQLAPGVPLLRRIAQIEAYTRRYIAGHWELLNSRARAGRVRDGHGDLRADAIYLTSNGIRIIDCLDFDERLRYGDIANEVAFLAMDIERLGRPDLSGELLAHFITDPDIPLLIDFYKSYRATVRAKVELLRSRQEDCAAHDKQTALDSATYLLELALDYAKGPKALLIVCGASGTGKSTLAAVLGEHLACEILSSDVVRKRLAGVEPNTPAAALYNQGIYAPEFSNRVYASLLMEATRLLSMGKGVILDATFGKRSQRQLAIATAQQAGVEALFIECRAHEDVIIRRLSERGQYSQRVSDATVEIYLTQSKEFEPLDEVPSASRHVVDTTNEVGAAVMEIERRVYATKHSSIRSREARGQ
jgi:aminoglycoside phosphotransferase family enzyme/predicted kinase